MKHLGLLIQKHESQEDLPDWWTENRVWSVNGVAYIVYSGVIYVIIPNIVEVETKE